MLNFRRLNRLQLSGRALLRLFLAFVVVFGFTFDLLLTTKPTTSRATTCSGGYCESAGACWPPGFEGHNSDTGCRYTCANGSWSNPICDLTAQEVATAQARKEEYERAAAGTKTTTGSGGSTGGGVSTLCGSSFPTATVCRGKPMFSTQQGYVCVPTSGDACAAREPGSVGADADGDGRYEAALSTASAAELQSGACDVVLSCACPSGVKKTCLSAGVLGSASAESYCARRVCPAVGTGGKVCEPGSVNCIPGTTSGYLCKPDGTGFMTESVHAHACGATSGTSYCDGGAAGATCPVGMTRTETAGGAVNCCGTKRDCERTGADCSSTSIKIETTITTCGSTQIRRFIGCGTQPGKPEGQANCYNICQSGVVRNNVCIYEPGLSCGAKAGVAPQPTPVPQTQTVVQTPAPTPTPTPRPKATCGQNCNQNTPCQNSLACVSGVCRSTACSVSEQNAQCVCQPPPPVAPVCVAIYASKTDIKLGDEVTFTCGRVPNTERYEFRYGFTTLKSAFNEATLTELPPATATSNISQTIKVDKIGRFLIQCRPCGANNLCQAWEPLGGQIGGPTLAPEESVVSATPTPTPAPTPTLEPGATPTPTPEPTPTPTPEPTSTPTPTPTPTPRPTLPTDFNGNMP